MRNVQRVAEPQVLAINAEKWKRAVENAKSSGMPITADLLQHYKHPEVLDSLKRMYSDEDGRCYCCYCETQIDIVDYPHIEHRKPKSLFPECAFDWDNLHLACQRCNIAKSDRWDAENEILDAVTDRPVSSHLGYRLGGVIGIYRETLTTRGITTVEHATLDRKQLLRARLEVFQSTFDAIQAIKRMGDDPRAHTAAKMLWDKCSGQYGTLIEWLLNLCLKETLPVSTRKS